MHIYIFLIEVPLTREKLLCPFKNEIQDLLCNGFKQKDIMFKMWTLSLVFLQFDYQCINTNPYTNEIYLLLVLAQIKIYILSGRF